MARVRASGLSPSGTATVPVITASTAFSLTSCSASGSEDFLNSFRAPSEDLLLLLG